MRKWKRTWSIIINKKVEILYLYILSKVKCFQVYRENYREYVQNATLESKMPLWTAKCDLPFISLGIHAVCCLFLLRQYFRSFPLQASRRIPLHGNTVPNKLMPVAYLVIITVVPKYSHIYLPSNLWSREEALLRFCGWNEDKSPPSRLAKRCMRCGT